MKLESFSFSTISINYAVQSPHISLCTKQRGSLRQREAAIHTDNGGARQGKQQQDQRHCEAAAASQEVEEACTRTKGLQQQRSEGVLRGVRRGGDEEVCDPHRVPGALGIWGAAQGGRGGVWVSA